MIYIKNFKHFSLIACFILLILLLVYSREGTNGAIKGILICGNVIIPSLFPFSVIVLIIIRSDIKILPDTEFAFLLSIVGGYPVGAQLIEEIYNKGFVTKKGANIMQCFCVNAGPAFVISAIGYKILHNKRLGIFLLISHILSSLTIKLFLSKKLKKESINVKNIKETNIDFNNLFCNSVKDAAASTISICSFVILFSVVNAILSQFDFLKTLTYLFEVTTAVSKIKNIYFISFLLGFSGISIWMQIFSLSKSSGINYIYFIVSRIIHGVLSVGYTYLQVLIFKPVLPTISNFTQKVLKISKPEIAISLIILVIVLILSLENKNNSRKKLKDLLK